jgi:hypothetical protein
MTPFAIAGLSLLGATAAAILAAQTIAAMKDRRKRNKERKK